MVKKIPSKLTKFSKKSSSLRENIDPLVSLQRKIIERKLKDKEILKRLKVSEKKLKVSDKSGQYILDRKFADYNFIFKELVISPTIERSSAFKKEIISTLSYLERKYKKSEINVLDDGAGKGYFLAELKEKWNSLKERKLVSADLKTTAVSLTRSLVAKNIDFKKIGNVLNFIPERKYDLILSVYGGFHYTQKALQREVLLKYLYSLNKGGLAILSFDTFLLKTSMGKAHREQVIEGLKKRGFRADISYIPLELKQINKNLPDVYLFVERVK